MQVKASVPVVVGLLSTEYRKDAVLAAKCLSFILQLLGHKFPNVRQTAGQVHGSTAELGWFLSQETGYHQKSIIENGTLLIVAGVGKTGVFVYSEKM